MSTQENTSPTQKRPETIYTLSLIWQSTLVNIPFRTLPHDCVDHTLMTAPPLQGVAIWKHSDLLFTIGTVNMGRLRQSRSLLSRRSQIPETDSSPAPKPDDYERRR